MHLHVLWYFLLKIFTRFDTFRADNTREKVQHESRRKAGGNLHLRSAVVDLRVQLVGTFTFFFLYTRKALHIALFLSLSLSVYRAMEFHSGAALYSLWNGIQIISMILFTLYFIRQSILARFNWHQQMLFLSPSLSCDKHNKHVMCTKGSKR